MRRAAEADVPSIAALCLDVFGGDDASRGILAAGLTRRPRTQDEWSKQLSAALLRKAAAEREARGRRAPPAAAAPAAGRAAAAGRARAEREEAREAERRRRQRQFVCLVAEDAGSGAVVACVAVTLARPEAALPPPFPTASPLRCYASNMAVAPVWRRRGVASALLARCEAVAARWRYDSIWLHMDEANDAAAALYECGGYEQRHRSPYLVAKRQRLLRKEIQPWRPTPRPPPPPANVGGSRGPGGVFIWDVADEDSR